MGFFEKIFPQKLAPQQEQIRGYFETLTAYTPQFTSFSGGIYEAAITRAAIHAFANHVSKLKPEIKGGAVAPRRIQQQMNPWQTTSQFLYRTATVLSVNNTAFIVPILSDDLKRVVGYYTVCPNQCEVLDYKGEPWLRYRFRTGKTGLIEFERCGVLTQFQYQDDLFGSSNQSLLPTLQLIHTTNQGIIEGTKNAASVRFMAKLASVLKPSDIDAERKRFTASNFAADNQGGVMMFDAKYADVKQIQSQPYVVNAEEMKLINDSVYNYFGVSEKVLRNEWNEQEYTAFYEGKIEPFAVQLGLVMTKMTFSPREVEFGNEVMFSANRLQYASAATKLSVSQQLLDRGILSRNEVRDIWQLPHIDGGDDYIIRAEYVNAYEKVNESEEPQNDNK